MTGTLDLPEAKIPKTITLEPAGGSKAPTRCGSGNNSITVVGGLPRTAPPRTSVRWEWAGFPQWGGTGMPIVKFVGIEIRDSLKISPGAFDPITPAKVTDFLKGTIGPLKCPCTAANDPIQFNATDTSYPSPDGKSLNLAVGSLNSLEQEEFIFLLYTLWFTTTTGKKTIWWAYDPEVDLEKDIENPPIIGRLLEPQLGKLIIQH